MNRFRRAPGTAPSPFQVRPSLDPGSATSSRGAPGDPHSPRCAARRPHSANAARPSPPRHPYDPCHSKCGQARRCGEAREVPSSPRRRSVQDTESPLEQLLPRQSEIRAEESAGQTALTQGCSRGWSRSRTCWADCCSSTRYLCYAFVLTRAPFIPNFDASASALVPR